MIDKGKSSVQIFYAYTQGTISEFSKLIYIYI